MSEFQNFPSYQQLAGMTDDQLVALYDRLAGQSMLRGRDLLDELSRRAANRQAAAIASLTRVLIALTLVLVVLTVALLITA